MKDAPPRFSDFANEFIDDAPCGIVVTDPDGRLKFLNATLAGWLGLSAVDAVEDLTFPQLLTLPGRLFYETHIAPMMLLQGFVREISCHLEVRNGPALPVMLSGVARVDRQGRPHRYDYTIFDARERRMYEEALREARDEANELAAIVRSSPNAILRVDDAGMVKSWNRGAERLLGRSAEDAVGRPVDEVVPLTGNPSWFTAIRRADSEAAVEAAHESGHEFEVTIAPIDETGGSGASSDSSVVLRDVSLRNQAERRLKAIADEMHHRVKNVLSVVAGIARQTMAREHTDTFIARLSALAQAQDALARSSWTKVDLCELLAFAAAEAGGADRFTFSGPSVMLEPEHATALSMAFHELVTNAFKYGALSNPNGKIVVRHALIPARPRNRVKLIWHEQNGPPVSAPTREGFGTRLIKTFLAGELGAEVKLQFPTAGLQCEVTFGVT